MIKELLIELRVIQFHIRVIRQIGHPGFCLINRMISDRNPLTPLNPNTIINCTTSV